MDGIQLPGRIAPVAAASTLIFLALLFVNTIYQGATSNKVNPQEHYDRLAGALFSAGLMPAARSDDYALAIAQHALKPEQINYPHGVIALGSTIGLGEAITGYVNNTEVYQVEISPGEYKLLKPGALRKAFREFHRRKQSQLLPVSNGQKIPLSQSFSIYVGAGGAMYRMQPVFRSGRCVKLLITR